MYQFIKPLLFSLPAETAHHFTMNQFKNVLKLPFAESTIRKMYDFEHSSLKRKVFGLEFPNPIGLAAGFDKNAQYIDELSLLGFGFIEIGTVTPLPQKGNEKPRLFRLPKDKALINRMGFNNEGMKAAVENLKKRQSNVIIGGNIGKNKVTPNEEAINDYVKCFEELYPYVDYFVVNVSSPNTPNLRHLQEKKPLSKILGTLRQLNSQKMHHTHKPILLKIAPDLNIQQLEDIIDIVVTEGIDGIIATNTTISREGLVTSKRKVESIGNGGVSGQPVSKKSTEIIKFIVDKTNHTVPVIGVGGIMTPDDAKEKLDAGASLIQLYTGFVYGGAEIVKNINKSLVKY